MRKFLWFAAPVCVVLLGAGVFFSFYSPRIVEIGSGAFTQSFTGGKASTTGNAAPPKEEKKNKALDIEAQRPLPDPPSVVKAIYATSWSAGSKSKIESLLNLISRTELNGIVIDIKDYSGFIAYKTGLPEFEASGAEKDIRILQPNKLIKSLHDKQVYVIGRISVFQDTVLAEARPEWALKDNVGGATWTDRKGLSWLDPAERRVWEYNAALAKDALARGFDEINFDYIRFASDGELERIAYPAWDGTASKAAVIKDFFAYLRRELGGAKISADLFGLSTVNKDDLGIGQVIENAYPYFDFVSPMVYPSHYASGFLGFKNPALYPYEVIKYSMDNAMQRLRAYGEGLMARASTTATTTPHAMGSNPGAKLRPWLQDFDLGAVYDAAMIQKQIQAVEDALLKGPAPEAYAGWLLWDPANSYTSQALSESL